MATEARTRTAGSGDRARSRGAEVGLSIVVPVLNEAAGLAALHARLVEVARRLAETRGLKCEVVYVDDGSRDATFAVAQDLPATSLDGQHPPDLIDTLVSHWLDQGYDVAYTAKRDRQDESWMIRSGSRLFYTALNWGARHKIPADAGDFRLLSPRAAAALRQLPERNRFFKGLASWIGFRQIRVDYKPAERTHGRSTWNIFGLIGLSIEGLTSFSVAPLRLASLLGLLLACTSLGFRALILFGVVVHGVAVPGYPSLVVGLMVLGGVQLLMIGIMGEYIGKILSEMKGRPAYFVAEHSIRTADSTGQGMTARSAESTRSAAATRSAAE